MRARHKGGQSRNYPEVRPVRGTHTDGMTRASHGQPGFSKRRSPDLLDEDILAVGGFAGSRLNLCPITNYEVWEDLDWVDNGGFENDLNADGVEVWYGSYQYPRWNAAQRVAGGADAGAYYGQGDAGGWNKYWHNFRTSSTSRVFDGGTRYRVVARAKAIGTIPTLGLPFVWFGMPSSRDNGNWPSPDYGGPNGWGDHAELLNGDWASGGADWADLEIEWTPAADAMNPMIAFSEGLATDEVKVQRFVSVDNTEQVGSSEYAARCNHGHHHLDTRAPLVTDDADAGYSVGNAWIDTTNERVYVLVNATAGAAVWLEALPRLHASTHQSGGSDPIKLDDLATPDDNTDLNASAARHGLLPKLSGVASDALRGDGTWSAVPDLAAHTGDAVDAHDASAISIADAGNHYTGTDVEAALQEAATHIHGVPTGYYRPLMDGLGNVVTDGGSGAAIMAYAED